VLKMADSEGLATGCGVLEMTKICSAPLF